MELARHPRQAGKLWQIDKVGRWRSKEWLAWIRAGQPVAGKQGYGGLVVAAHYRYPGCGMGVKPADCLVYPMYDAEHKRFHNQGQPDQAIQWGWAVGTMASGCRSLLTISPLARQWVNDLVLGVDFKRPPSTGHIEITAWKWASFFLSGDLAFITKRSGSIPE